MGDEAWKKFYEENLPPADLDEVKSQISDFCDFHFQKGTPIVLVTVSILQLFFK